MGLTPRKARLKRKDEKHRRDAARPVVDRHADGLAHEDETHAQRHGDEQSSAADGVDHVPLSSQYIHDGVSRQEIEKEPTVRKLAKMYHTCRKPPTKRARSCDMPRLSWKSVGA